MVLTCSRIDGADGWMNDADGLMDGADGWMNGAYGLIAGRHGADCAHHLLLAPGGEHRGDALVAALRRQVWSREHAVDLVCG